MLDFRFRAERVVRDRMEEGSVELEYSVLNNSPAASPARAEGQGG